MSSVDVVLVGGDYHGGIREVPIDERGWPVLFEVAVPREFGFGDNPDGVLVFRRGSYEAMMAPRDGERWKMFYSGE